MHVVDLRPDVRRADFFNETVLSESSSIGGNVFSGTFPLLDIPVSEAPGGQRMREGSAMLPLRVCSYHLWTRIYAHALLLESRIFPYIRLDDESPDYLPFGFVDTWKGNDFGRPVYIKAVQIKGTRRTERV